MSLIIFRVVDIEAGKNVVKGSPGSKGRGIDKFIIAALNRKPRRLQAVVWLKKEVPRSLPVL